MLLFSSLLVGFLSTTQASGSLSLSVPADGDEVFPTNGEFWLTGRDLSKWPQQVVLPNGFPKNSTQAPWEKNPDLRDLWREPRRVRWREDNLRARLKNLVGPGEGIALVEAQTGIGLALRTTLFPVSFRPPLTPGEAQENAKARAAKNVFEMLVVRPEKTLKPLTNYALIANGELVNFSTSTGPDTSPPEWEGLSEIRHEGEYNSVYEVNPASDDSPYPVRVEIYRGEIKNVKLRQYALVEKRFQTGRLSPFNESCVFAKAVDVAGNATEMLPCFAFPPLPEAEEPQKRGCSSTSLKTSKAWTWILAVFGLLSGLRRKSPLKPTR
jgi:hypothetical protein